MTGSRIEVLLRTTRSKGTGVTKPGVRRVFKNKGAVWQDSRVPHYERTAHAKALTT